MPLHPAIHETPQPNPNALIEGYSTDSDDESFSRDDELNLSFLDLEEADEVDDSYFFYHYNDFANIFNTCRSTPAREQDSLKFAIKNGEIETVKAAIKNMDAAAINYSSEKTSSLLMTAAYVNNIEIFDLLIDKKADINMVDSEGVTPLSIACKYEALDMIDLLINKKADFTYVDIYGESEFELALKHKQYKIAEILYKAGARTDDMGFILADAIKSSATLEDVNSLLKYCGDDDRLPEHTPLMLSLGYENLEIKEISPGEFILRPDPGQTDATEIMERLIEFKVQLIAQADEAPGHLMSDF